MQTVHPSLAVCPRQPRLAPRHPPAVKIQNCKLCSTPAPPQWPIGTKPCMPHLRYIHDIHDSSSPRQPRSKFKTVNFVPNPPSQNGQSVQSHACPTCGTSVTSTTSPPLRQPRSKPKTVNFVQNPPSPTPKSTPPRQTIANHRQPTPSPHRKPHFTPPPPHAREAPILP
jgi:hypothetical protein